MQLQPRPTVAHNGAAASERRTAFLHDAWYVAMWADDLAPETLVARTILEQPLVFFRTAGGSVAAIVDRCSHRFAPLSKGKLLAGDRIECGYHGLQFNAAGRCTRNPYGTQNVPPAAHLRTYPVVEKHSLVWIWMGAGASDPATIPDFSVFDRTPAEHVADRDYLHVNAPCELVNNNLLDLSHTSFLHEGIHSNADGIGAEIVVEEEGDAVMVSRISHDVEIPGLMRRFLPEPIPRVDKWNTIRWTPAGNMLLKSGVCRPGTGRETGTGIYGVHFLTPETAATTHYFFTATRWNVLTPSDTNAEIMTYLSEIRRYAFEHQDAPMIEAQYQRMLAEPGLKPMLLAIDAGPVRYQRVLARLIEAETTPAQAAANAAQSVVAANAAQTIPKA